MLYDVWIIASYFGVAEDALMGQSSVGVVRAYLRAQKSLVVILAALGSAGACGCSGPGVMPASAPKQISIAGTVTASQQPVAGSSVQVHVLVPSNAGTGTAPGYSTTATTDSDGSFRLTEQIACPSSDSVLYLQASGGRTVALASANPAIDLITILGSCGTLSSRSGIVLNEFTTVGTLWPLSPYISPAVSSASSSALAQAVTTAGELVDLTTGSAPGTLPSGEFAPVEKINTLGSILSGCIDSAGGTAGDGSLCGRLFSAVAAQNGTAPHDVLTAALQIARNPTWNVAGIFNLYPSPGTVQPNLSTAPSDWTLPILTQPTSPSFSPNGGTLNSGQTITITDETPDATIYYTLDGSLPSASSSLYAGPIPISASTTVTAVAIKQSVQSAIAASAFSVALPISIALTPTAVTLGPSQSQLFQAKITGTPQSAVSYSIQPAVGTISTSGLYTAPSFVGTAATVTLSARAAGGSAQTAQAVINVIPGSLQLTIPNTFVTVGSALTASVTLSQPAPQGGSVVTLTTSDSTIAGLPATVTVAAGNTQTSFTATGQKQGQATVTATAPGFGSTTGTLLVNAAAIPKQFMGLNVGDTVNRWPTLQFGTLDTNSHVQWPETNSAPGVYDFSALDNYFQFAQTYGADAIFPLMDTPAWASSNPTAAGKDGPGTCAPPSNISYWDDYVRAVATYAGTRIKYWMVWNEVSDSGYWCGDMPTLVTMVQHARNIIRSINPNALIVSPTTIGLPYGPNTLTQFLAAGGGRYVDVIGFHGYNTATAEDLLPVIAAYQQVLTQNKVNLPLWDTEADWAGLGNATITDPAAQGAFIAKYFLLHWSLGVVRFIWYEYDGGPWGGLTTSATTGFQQTLAAVAYGESYKWMVGASMNTLCSSTADGTWTCGLVRPGGYFATVMWNSTQNVEITIPTGAAMYRDLTGAEHKVTAGSAITIGNQPLLFENSTLPN